MTDVVPSDPRCYYCMNFLDHTKVQHESAIDIKSASAYGTSPEQPIVSKSLTYPSLRKLNDDDELRPGEYALTINPAGRYGIVMEQVANPYYTRSKHISFTDEVTVEFSVPASPKPKLMTFTYNPETKEAKLYADNAVSDLAVERHEAKDSTAIPTIDDMLIRIVSENGDFLNSQGIQAIKEFKAHLRTTILSALPAKAYTLEDDILKNTKVTLFAGEGKEVAKDAHNAVRDSVVDTINKLFDN